MHVYLSFIKCFPNHTAVCHWHLGEERQHCFAFMQWNYDFCFHKSQNFIETKCSALRLFDVLMKQIHLSMHHQCLSFSWKQTQYLWKRKMNKNTHNISHDEIDKHGKQIHQTPNTHRWSEVRKYTHKRRERSSENSKCVTQCHMVSGPIEINGYDRKEMVNVYLYL